MDFDDRYSSDPLSRDWRREGRPKVATVTVEPGLVLELAESGWTGAVLSADRAGIRLEDRHGKVRLVRLDAGFLVDGAPVRLALPSSAAPRGPARSASGSVAVENASARVARASRILVEGRHDAELVEKVWGHDLRVEGVVVEYLAGIDHLEAYLDDFHPTSDRRLGVLVDHLVPGSKESRIAEAVSRSPHGPSTLVLGHPYVDVWQSVRPARLGLTVWPEIPRDTEWKHGICQALGWPHADQADIAAAWQRILGTVRTFADLEPSLLGRVEELIDFVTADGSR